MHLITCYPEDFLNRKGIILYYLVTNKDWFSSITELAQFFKVDVATASKMCSQMHRKGQLDYVLIRPNKKKIVFSEEVSEKALRVMRKTLKSVDFGDADGVDKDDVGDADEC